VNDLISVDSSSGLISVSKFKKVGIYQIEIVGVLSDLVTKASSIFTIDIKQNTKKKINSKIEIIASTSSLYSLSFIEGTPDEYVTHRLLPNFVTFKFPYYKLMPSTKSDVGNSIIQGQLFSTEKIVSFQIKVTVINKPPTLSSGNIPD
jgi:hypothetical protein